MVGWHGVVGGTHGIGPEINPVPAALVSLSFGHGMRGTGQPNDQGEVGRGRS